MTNDKNINQNNQNSTNQNQSTIRIVRDPMHDEGLSRKHMLEALRNPTHEDSFHLEHFVSCIITKDNHKLVSRRLQQRRMHLDITQEEIADMTDISLQQIKRYESSKLNKVRNTNNIKAK